MTKLDEIATLIQELGYKALVTDDLISTSMSGWNVGVFPYNDDSIQMYLGFTIGAEDNFDFSQANEFNKVNRYSKCYVTDNTAAFEQDFFFDVSKPTAKNDLERIFATWEGIIGLAREALDKSTQERNEQTSPSAE
ncbi:hypothetical protein [Acidocella sp.]|uniref:hypothetical protein n=1 Tax=Acidocella sp. TaxID=50710 RepID=UPI003CFE2AEB